MKVMKRVLSSAILCCALIFAAQSVSMAQNAVEARKSPMAMTNLLSGETYVSIVYSQPHMRDRKVFGGLVPFGEIWRLGANEATQITLTSDVEVGGETLEKGTYTMFAVPEEDKWTIVFNSKLGQWGSYDYNSEFDVLRVPAEVEQVEEPWEAFTLNLEEAENGAILTMIWENTQAMLPITF
jgi:hypothetical protein